MAREGSPAGAFYNSGAIASLRNFLETATEIVNVAKANVITSLRDYLNLNIKKYLDIDFEGTGVKVTPAEKLIAVTNADTFLEKNKDL